MKKIVILIWITFILFSCWKENNILDKILTNKDYIEYSLTFNEKKKLSENWIWVKFFDYNKVYFGNTKKNIDIKVNKNTKDIIFKILNWFDYKYIHLWHKLSIEYVNNFSKLLKNTNNNEILFIIDPIYLNEDFIKNLNSSNLKKINLFLEPISCWKKYYISEKILKELIKSKNIISFNIDRCREDYKFENKKLLDTYITWK